MINNLFLCYRRYGAQTAKLFSKYLKKHTYPCNVWYSDMETIGNFKYDIENIFSNMDGVIIFVSSDFVSGFLEEKETECITAREIEAIARKKQQNHEFIIITVNIDGYSFSIDDEAVLFELLSGIDIEDPLKVVKEITLCNRNYFNTASDDEDDFFERLVENIFPEINITARNSTSNLMEYMNEFLAPNNLFNGLDDTNTFYWGTNRTLIMPKNIFEGWNLSDIVIESLDTTEYKFRDKTLTTGFVDYMQSDNVKSIIAHGNNKNRWMIAEYEISYETGSIFLHMKKTNWCTNQYVWNYLKSNSEEKKMYLSEVEEGNDELLPNSLCLHLVVIDCNDNVLLTQTSRMKKNDYPLSVAATVGEQIEESDFIDGNNIKKEFIKDWVERAFFEEFGILSNSYKKLINTDSICPVALTLEGDIYNIALVTIVKLNCSLDEFDAYVKSHPISDKEFRKIIPLKITDIPKFFAEYQKQEAELTCHPSTFLRLFLCYINKFGVNNFEDNYRKWLQ